MTRKVFLYCVAALATVALAQAKPNFSGEWKLNVEKSNFGPMPAPEKMSMKIDHKDPSMKVSQSQSGPQGDMTFDASYSTDGKETSNTFGPMTAKSTAKWEGETLVIDTKLETGGGELTIKGKWTLSADGKQMTNNSHIVSPQGEIDVVYVLDKQ